MSTFYADGFQDCINYIGFMPPDQYTRDDGEKTNVYRQEYIEGYEAAQRVIARGKVSQYREKRKYK